MERGYFPVFRRIFDSDIWGHKIARDLFIYILGHVTHYPTKLCANYGLIDIEPGQMVTGLHSLAAGCRFSFQQIRSAISYLESTNRITRKATRRYSVITVCNWEAYREAQFGEQQTKKQEVEQTDNKQITNRQQTDNNIQEVKKLRSKRKDQDPMSPDGDLPAAWNEICISLTKCSKVTQKRRAHIAARIKEYPIEKWREIFTRIEASDFCRGLLGNGAWRADFDWITKSPDNAVKVLEGRYDNRAGSVSGEQKFIRELRMKASGGVNGN